MDLEILKIASYTENHKILSKYTHKSKLKNSLCNVSVVDTIVSWGPGLAVTVLENVALCPLSTLVTSANFVAGDMVTIILVHDTSSNFFFYVYS